MTRLIWIPFALSLAACPSSNQCQDGDNSDNCDHHELPDAATVTCGDHVCQASESQQTCPQDCGTPVPVCGNGVCETGETASSCAVDCASKILVDNTSSLTIEYIYAWACTASSATRVDILGAYTLAPNYHIEIDTVNPGCWDYEAVSTTNATAYQYNIQQTPRELFTWTLSN